MKRTKKGNKGTCGSHIKNKKKKKQHKHKQDIKGTVQFVFFFIFSFYSLNLFFLRFTSFGPSEFVGINTESVLRDEGYA